MIEMGKTRQSQIRPQDNIIAVREEDFAVNV